MSVRSTTFGGVTLSDKDADKFINQVKYGQPKAAAVKAAQKGKDLVTEFKQNGSVKISLKK
jgi:hypothetical protein